MALPFLFLLLTLTTTSAADSHPLISFKSSLPNPNVLSDWLPGRSICSYSGVLCGDSGSLSVDLHSLPLDADLKSVSPLLSLDGLERLSLRSSNLSGDIDVLSGSRCAGSLHELDLSGNSVSGFATAIEGIGCSSLVTLNLSGNSLAFPANAGAGGRLGVEVVDLSVNKISGGGVLKWALSAGGVRRLNLSRNAISGELPAIDLPAMEDLDLSFNNISGGLSPSFNCSALLRLDLSSNSLSGDVPSAAFVSCFRLTSLNLSSNHLSGDLPSVPGTLSSLLLAENEFSGRLSDCHGLVDLDVSSNHLHGPIDFSDCPSLNLKNLILSYNSFSGSLPDSISDLYRLELLDLSSNNLTGQIPQTLCGNPNFVLKELYLQDNLFTGTVPASLANCSGLISLDLSFNFLKGPIPSTFGSLSRLRDLIMWLNLLDGEIPQELSMIQTLENLILDNNGLVGTIPSGLQNCTNLNWLSLSSNELSGPIPPWIGRMSNLAILKLGNNSFSGPIPPEIGDCRSLVWLDLNSNQLNGSIPITIAKQSGKIAVGLVTGKRYVYLKNDGSAECRGAGNLLEFAGIRPEQLNRVPTRRSCNFTRVYMGSTKYTFNNNGSMIFLDLSYNHLDQPIPEELGSMYYLMVLNLGHNDLSGPIPVNLGSLKSVAVLDLSYNALEGPIPGSFSGMSMLSEIDLSHNRLNGSIPELGQLATFPAYRYENNSGLCGFPLPPCEANANSTGMGRQKSHRRQASLAGSIAMGLLFSLFCIFGLIIIAVESRKRQRRKSKEVDGGGGDHHSESRSYSASAWKFTGTREAMSINLATFEKPLRKLTFADLLEATNGFHSESLIGSGGFGDVYKAQLKDGNTVAIKKLINVSRQGDKEFMAEMETIGKIKHRNLVPLLGYCKVGEERLLVYEYMRFGSLDDVLHDHKKLGIKLDWPARRKIAPTDSADFGDNNLVGWVKQHARLKITDVFDRELMKGDPTLEMELLQHLKIACACLDDRPWRRPTMLQVMAMFKEIQVGSGVSAVSGSDGSLAEVVEGNEHEKN
ncbi:hypothetical protein QJS10_CPB22g00926 [Acorus calamus]|uniref:non-specific serine/threonine protein kinase n=1 Tax=Acorus calamus TaxID=4465 RepID=A0AAV9C2E6_ACOCL|nr:hypothetical protein QJS10_CPB22g00926 [Acorus calamus]